VLILRGLQAFNDAETEDFPHPRKVPSIMSANGLSIMSTNGGQGTFD
jgi:hypothetical protein